MARREEINPKLSDKNNMGFHFLTSACIGKIISQNDLVAIEILQTQKERLRMDGDVAIVVVDDDRPSREFIESAVNIISSNISVFSDCWSAWMHIKSNSVDLVISDVYMSGMNGFDLLRTVKQVFPQTWCIMISGDHSLEKRIMELGADAFLSKPFNVGTLIGSVRKLTTSIEKT